MRRWLVVAILLLWSGCGRLAGDVSPTPASSPPSGEPKLTIKVGPKTKTWTRSELLDHEGLKSLTLEDRSAYEGQTQTYLAIPIVSLFEGMDVPANRAIEYLTTDGFNSSIEAGRLLSQEGSIAYLAVEDPARPWPDFKNRNYGAGPFYLVWERPEVSDIGREEWPFKLTAFQDRSEIETRYPRLPPAASLSPDHPIRLGYKLYLKNCFPCHKLNGEGQATFGPDLNEPMSPTEYLAEGMIHKLVRNPQSLRTWTGSKMPAFDQQEITDEELDQIVRYLEHKAKTRNSS